MLVTLPDFCKEASVYSRKADFFYTWWYNLIIYVLIQNVIHDVELGFFISRVQWGPTPVHSLLFLHSFVFWWFQKEFSCQNQPYVWQLSAQSLLLFRQSKSCCNGKSWLKARAFFACHIYHAYYLVPNWSNQQVIFFPVPVPNHFLINTSLGHSISDYFICPNVPTFYYIVKHTCFGKVICLLPNYGSGHHVTGGRGMTD